MDKATPAPTLDDLRAAAERIRPYAHRTPVFTCAALDARAGARLFFKAENLQKVGAFKFRGACNAVFSLSASEAARGVTTHSSGNHAQALALAARLRGIPARIVMPRNAPEVKKAAVAGYGAQIIFCEPTLEARETATARVMAETGATLVHPYDDPRIIAGQGTAAMELLEDQPGLDLVIAPVGGGGLLSGTAIAVKSQRSGTSVIGAEPAAADDAHRSFTTKTFVPSLNPQTVADGLLTSLGKLTFPLILERVDAIVTVTEEEIVAAMRLVWERMKLVIEPSAAVPVAAVLCGRLDVKGKQAGVILSGGNLDLPRF